MGAVARNSPMSNRHVVSKCLSTESGVKVRAESTCAMAPGGVKAHSHLQRSDAQHQVHSALHRRRRSAAPHHRPEQQRRGSSCMCKRTVVELHCRRVLKKVAPPRLEPGVCVLVRHKLAIHVWVGVVGAARVLACARSTDFRQRVTASPGPLLSLFPFASCRRPLSRPSLNSLCQSALFTKLPFSP